jgi:flavin reductase (DIM6/NTAB) family NADH-FMN oxidoreductase RutF
MPPTRDRRTRTTEQGDAAMHRTVEPAILYFGTPVVLVSSENEDGTTNVAPMSSAWWLGWSCMLGFGARSKTPANILRTGECVLNLASVDQVGAVDRLARTTGSNPVPPHKVAMGYRHEPDKLGAGGLTAVPSEVVRPPRLLECPVQMEATLEGSHAILAGDEARAGKLIALEVRIRRVHVDEGLLMDGHQDRIDPLQWRPLIMSFQQFFGLAPQMLHHSRLGEIPESAYRAPAPRPVAATTLEFPTPASRTPAATTLHFATAGSAS